ncbi:carboxypeptidase-like regulatory domain-containing protein [Silvibacterium acidisoli]|uniref:carboxypeptidase-like regulatory domain-containing protein n=1 Tax=Acidobacteriaceae bacterium ZG23-2 TaxID=2883246 RepID=UPI00406D49F0
MRKSVRLTGLVLVLLLSTALFAQAKGPKSLEGKVWSESSTPISGAIVYLQDSKSNSIRTFISTKDGEYRFGQLSPDIDYQVWAQYKGSKSPSKTVSSFDSRKLVTIDFHMKNE